MGFAIGYIRRCHRSTVGLVVFLVVLAAVASLAFSDYQLGGCACGPGLAIIATVPAIAGAVTGSALRELLDPERSNPHLPR